MLELLTDPSAWVALASLAALEIVLGIDNIVFIAILTNRLPVAQRPLAYRLGLSGALITRIMLLLGLSWVMGLTAPLFVIFGQEISGRNIILFSGGLFLIGKSAHEMYAKVEALEEEEEVKGSASNFVFIIVQISILDIIFSLDSVITAVGIANDVRVMIAAIVIAVAIMLLFAERVGRFVNDHPSMQVLALSFLLLIGVLLVAESLDQHVNKAYIYSAMGFALFVELLNIRFRKKRTPVTANLAEAIEEYNEDLEEAGMPVPDEDSSKEEENEENSDEEE